MEGNDTNVISHGASLLHERIHEAEQKILKLNEDMEQYNQLNETLEFLPKKLKHSVMVPLGKRAIVPGYIVRSNEILAHLGSDHFAWQSAFSAVEIVQRRQNDLKKDIDTAEKTLASLLETSTEVKQLDNIKKLYAAENIKEITETEEESERLNLEGATKEDIEEYFEIENEERRKQREKAFDWDELMKRMDELEAAEAGSENAVGTATEDTSSTDIVDYKSKGNVAFAQKQYKTAVQHYTNAIKEDPSSHVLYTNRSAAYHRLKNYREALEDAETAIKLNENWVKGFYRKAAALASLGKYELAALAYEQAHSVLISTTNSGDPKILEQANAMRKKASEKKIMLDDSSSNSISDDKKNPPNKSTISQAFSGNILERDASSQSASNQEASDFTSRQLLQFQQRHNVRSLGSSRFETGKTVRFESVGSPQPVQRVSRFKASRTSMRNQESQK